MLKFILPSLLVIITSFNLYSQKLCEESFPTNGIFKTPDPSIIIIAGYLQLKWFNVETCEFVDSLVYHKENLTAMKTGISSDGKTAVVRFENQDGLVSLTRYNLETKESGVDYDLTEFSQFATRNGFHISNDGERLIILSGKDQKLSEHNLVTGELIRFVNTPTIGLSHIRISNDGSLIGIFGLGSNTDNEIYLYESENLELIKIIRFRDYFEESDIETNFSFNFDPISNDLYLGSKNSLIKINPITLDKKVILENQILSFQALDKTPDGNKLVLAGLGSNWRICVIDLDSDNVFYFLNERSTYITVGNNFIISANPEFSNNIKKLGLVTNVINNIKGYKIDVYPNPTSGILNISLENNHPSNINIKLYDINGKQISTLYDDFYSDTVFSNDYNISNFLNGQYLLGITVNQKKNVVNVILEK